MSNLNKLFIPIIVLALSACASTQKNQTDQSKVRVTHLTRSSNTLPDAGQASINNPIQDGNVTIGTANLGEVPLARIETSDGYAPDMTSAFDSSTPKSVNQITVKQDDTVYSLARQHNLSVADLAKANSLDANFTIKPGQILVLDGTAMTSSGSSNKSTDDQAIDSQTKQANAPTAVQPETQAAKPSPSVTDLSSKQVNGLTWSWPLAGKIKVIKSFQRNTTNKGMELDGKTGDDVFAAGDGTVVYSGNELKGYGNLVILSHKGDYMSAYAHNSKLLVQADDTVKRGQKIAEVGSEESNQVKLFFQIRYKGEPINPVPLLPKP